MRGKSLTLIVIALTCGLVASIGISQLMKNRNADSGQSSPMEKIYVASAEIPLGQLLDAKIVKLEEWPKDKVPVGAVRKVEEVEGKRPLTRLYPGEPILMAKLVDANRFSGAAEKIPKGFRVASVLVTMDSSASGLINPGDRVDVLVFLKEGMGVNATATRTILKNVTVFAVNDRFKREVDDEGEGLEAKTVSLLVKPTQVEKIVLASELGKIKLSLRSSEDDLQDNARGATIDDLGSNPNQERAITSPVIATRSEASAAISDIDVTNMLRSQLDSRKTFVMRILTPHEVQVYNWDQVDSLPRELMKESDLDRSRESYGTEEMAPRVESTEASKDLESNLDSSEPSDTSTDLTSTATGDTSSN